MTTAMGVLTPLKAIRANCRDCCGGSVHEVARCQIERCHCWPYRMGRRPTSAMANTYLAAVSAAEEADSGQRDTRRAETEV